MVKSNIIMEKVDKLMFRNFAGAQTKFNPAGKRNFCVFIDEHLARNLENDGWNVRWLTAKNEGDNDQAYMQVAVSFDNVPPKIILISKNNKIQLDETSINILDWAEIANVDLIIRPYNWEVNGKKGVKAYVKTMYVTLVADEFEDRYRDIPEGAVDNLEDIPF